MRKTVNFHSSTSKAVKQERAERYWRTLKRQVTEGYSHSGAYDHVTDKRSAINKQIAADMEVKEQKDQVNRWKSKSK